MAVRGTATPQERLASILARANMPTLSEGLLFSEIRTLPSWVVRSICGEICRTLPTTIGRVVAADPHRRTRIELEQMDARHFGLELDFIVDGNPEHRAGLRRGRRADRGPDFGDEAGGRRAQRYRSGSAGGRARLLRRCGQARQFLIFGDHVAFVDEEIGDPGAFLIDADLRLAARHDESGDPHHVGEAGIGGFGHDHQRLARRFLCLGTGAVLEPVIADAQNSNEATRAQAEGAQQPPAAGARPERRVARHPFSTVRLPPHRDPHPPDRRRSALRGAAR